MAEIIWIDAYNIGVTEIDVQHKKLVSILNDLDKAHSKGTEQTIIFETINQLFDYTNYHFSLEQQMHLDYKYPGAGKHKNEHSQFIEKLNSLKLEAEKNDLAASLKILEFLEEWVITHILGSDKAFGDYLREVELQ